ncbi:5865_t:CDS:10 [Ambispora gerdemannii]|uniref:5865_t:CDS:1 n=1 Tax=Ambispora gerdemannii TaxID=144530 RepID=A0A9N8W0Q7_9GLOM|nr:5865_t:CDS:10 [Ambispora gerdemannii]
MPKTNKKRRQLLDFSQTDNKKVAVIECGHPKHQEYLDAQKNNNGTSNKNTSSLVRVPQRMVMALDINRDTKICTRCLNKTDKDPVYLNHPKFVTRKSQTKKNLLENLKIEMEGFKLDENLSRLLRDDSLCDLKILLPNGIPVPSHKSILVARSYTIREYFQKISAQPPNSPLIGETEYTKWEDAVNATDNIEHVSLEAIIGNISIVKTSISKAYLGINQYFYEDVIDWEEHNQSPHDFVAFILLVNKLRIDHLKQPILDHLEKYLSTSNAVPFMNQMTEWFLNDDILMKCVEYFFRVKAFEGEIFEQHEMQNLLLAAVKFLLGNFDNLLEDDTKDSDQEIIKFKFVMRWVKAHYEIIHEIQGEKLLEYIDFDLLEPKIVARQGPLLTLTHEFEHGGLVTTISLEDIIGPTPIDKGIIPGAYQEIHRYFYQDVIVWEEHQKSHNHLAAFILLVNKLNIEHLKQPILNHVDEYLSANDAVPFTNEMTELFLNDENSNNGLYRKVLMICVKYLFRMNAFMSTQYEQHGMQKLLLSAVKFILENFNVSRDSNDNCLLFEFIIRWAKDHDDIVPDIQGEKLLEYINFDLLDLRLIVKEFGQIRKLSTALRNDISDRLLVYLTTKNIELEETLKVKQVKHDSEKNNKLLNISVKSLDQMQKLVQNKFERVFTPLINKKRQRKRKFSSDPMSGFYSKIYDMPKLILVKNLLFQILFRAVSAEYLTPDEVKLCKLYCSSFVCKATKLLNAARDGFIQNLP